MSQHPQIHDRVKQYSQDTGTGNLTLTDNANGFATFGSVFVDGDSFFYAITDGSDYEIGSGIFVAGSPNNSIQRNCFVSSNSNNTVDFNSGRKEVFVTYPATHAVLMGSGLAGHSVPAKNGIAFWESEKFLNYDSDFVWLDTYKHLGIRKSLPEYAIDIGGDGSQESMVRASGYVVGPTGIHFPAENGNDSSYVGGIQYKHFLPNEIGDNNLNSVIELSGIVDNIFTLKDQNAGYFFAGPIPTANCDPNCGEAKPSFRTISVYDLPTDVVYMNQLTSASGYLQSQIDILDGGASSLSGVLQSQIDDNKECCDAVTSIVTGLDKARTFLVTPSGGAYTFDQVGFVNTSGNPDIELQKGQTYNFDINAVGHPFWIKSSGVVGTEAAYNNGVINNGTDSGVLTFTVPQDAPSRLYYNCQYHSSMQGDIYTVDKSAFIQYSEDVLLSEGYIGQVYYTDDRIYVYTSEGWKATLALTEIQALESAPAEQSIPTNTPPTLFASNSIATRYAPSFKQDSKGIATALKFDVSYIDNPSNYDVHIQIEKANSSGIFDGSIAPSSVAISGHQVQSFEISLPIETSDNVYSSGDVVRFRPVFATQTAATHGIHAYTRSLANSTPQTAGLYGGGYHYAGLPSPNISHLGRAKINKINEPDSILYQQNAGDHWDDGLKWVWQDDIRSLDPFGRLDLDGEFASVECAPNQATFFAVTHSNEVYGWGSNRNGLLNIIKGFMSSPYTNYPGAARLPVPPIKKIRAGDNFVIALTVDGKVICWGDPTNTADNSYQVIYEHPTMEAVDIDLFDTLAVFATTEALYVFGDTRSGVSNRDIITGLSSQATVSYNELRGVFMPVDLAGGDITGVSVGLEQIVFRKGTNLYGFGTSHATSALNFTPEISFPNIHPQLITSTVLTTDDAFCAGAGITAFIDENGTCVLGCNQSNITQDNGQGGYLTSRGSKVFLSKTSNKTFDNDGITTSSSILAAPGTLKSTLVILDGNSFLVLGTNPGLYQYNTYSTEAFIMREEGNLGTEDLNGNSGYQYLNPSIYGPAPFTNAGNFTIQQKRDVFDLYNPMNLEFEFLTLYGTFTPPNMRNVDFMGSSVNNHSVCMNKYGILLTGKDFVSETSDGTIIKTKEIPQMQVFSKADVGRRDRSDDLIQPWAYSWALLAMTDPDNLPNPNAGSRSSFGTTKSSR